MLCATRTHQARWEGLHDKKVAVALLAGFVIGGYVSGGLWGRTSQLQLQRVSCYPLLHPLGIHPHTCDPWVREQSV